MDKKCQPFWKGSPIIIYFFTWSTFMSNYFKYFAVLIPTFVSGFCDRPNKWKFSLVCGCHLFSWTSKKCPLWNRRTLHDTRKTDLGNPLRRQEVLQLQALRVTRIKLNWLIFNVSILSECHVQNWPKSKCQKTKSFRYFCYSA